MPNLIGGLILGFIWQFIFVNVFNGLGQALNQTWMMGWLSNEKTGFWGLVILTAWQMAGYVMAVSYTHLDVYKRQDESTITKAKSIGIIKANFNCKASCKEHPSPI